MLSKISLLGLLALLLLGLLKANNDGGRQLAEYLMAAMNQTRETNKVYHSTESL